MTSPAFGAPVVVFCYLDKTMGPGQWADAWMYLQTVMLLLRAEGLVRGSTMSPVRSVF
ncbi:hypothetical protein [Nonomuraea maritima]|uniref:hypothetical protein n=1 Tax=Nonomuraea maritima TaxID=683260 RepID=UPI001C40ABEA|nr:hypothetical protein [Nonomuraea maritima]